MVSWEIWMAFFDNVNQSVGEIATQVGTTPGGLERRGLFHDTTDL